MEGGFTSDRKLYKDADGKVVEADDPSRLTLLVAEGGSLPMDQARTLGLVDDDGNAVPRAESADADADADDGTSGEEGAAQPKRAAKAPAKTAARKR